MLVLLGITLFVMLVVVHELGHMIAAKRGGVEVEEFGIGFPPKAKSLGVKNGTEYTLNWLPIGGFVKLKGENDAATEKGSFGAASMGRKTLIIGAGVLMNWVSAAVIFTVLALVGMPQLIDNQFYIKSDAKVVKQEVFAGSVEKESPAYMAGLRQGDRLVSLDQERLISGSQLRSITTKKANTKVVVIFERDGERVTKAVTLRDDSERGNFGVAPGEQRIIRSTWSAPLVGVGTTAQFSIATLKGIGGALMSLLVGNASEAGQAVTGPVGIVAILSDLARQGVTFVLFLIGIISVSLAVMNLLPIPALDGGRLFVMLAFRALKRPLTKDIEEKIHGTGMIFLLLLAVVITVVDVKRLF